MIVDVHTHLPTHEHNVPKKDIKKDNIYQSGKEIKLTNTIDEYIKALEPVDKAFVFGIAPRPSDPGNSLVGPKNAMEINGKNHNDIAYDLYKRFPEKIIPFMSLHPFDPNINDEYDRATTNLKCKGIKLGANYQNFDPLSKEAFNLYHRLEKDNYPIVFHQGTSPMSDAPLQFAHPLVIDEIAIKFPKLKMILAHLGHPWHADCISVIRKHKNVWADISAQFYRPWSFWNGMRLFYEWGVLNKILFASDWPISSPKDNITGLRNLNKFTDKYNLPKIPDIDLEEIINRNALEVLEINQ